jgi:molecular chaperone GrpE
MSRTPDETPVSAAPAAGPEAATEAASEAATEATTATRAADDESAGMAALEAERDTLRDRLLRALAEAENTRKRAERDRREAQDYAATRFARDLLPVHDSLRRALDAMGEAERAAAPSVVEGIELTLRAMLGAFARHGIHPVAPQPGDTFDPERHEAVFEAPLPGHAPGSVIQVMAEGFTIHDRLLRPAQVGVASAAVSAASAG